MHVARVRSVHGRAGVRLGPAPPVVSRGRQVKHRTLAWLTALPEPGHRRHRAAACGASGWWPPSGAVRIMRSLPHGHVAAILGTRPAPRAAGALERRSTRERDCAGPHRARMSRARLEARHGRPSRADHARPELDIEGASEDELYGRWTGCSAASERSRRASRVAISRRAGSCCTTSPPRRSRAATARSRATAQPRPAARPGPDRVRPLDRRARLPGRRRGVQRQHRRPVHARAQIAKLRDRFGLTEVVLVGDRGMLTSARISGCASLAGSAG